MLMEWIVLTEQNEQPLEENSVQTVEKVVEKAQKKRSESDKYGINRYNQLLLKRSLDAIEDIRGELRWMRHKLDRLGEADYSKEDVEHFAVLDAVDKEIIQRLLEVGAIGALPKDVAAEVNRRGGYGLRYYEVSRRLVRLNKKLHFETGKLLFEKRGHRWALTKFALEVYGSIDEGLQIEAAATGSEEEL
jgi:hypothetical protein